MAFEKMTEGALYDKFIKLFPSIIGEKYDKIGARMLRIETCGGPVLYFLWYDENNWNLGTKPYRNRPMKQQLAKMRQKLEAENTFNDLKKDVETLPPETNVTVEEAVLQMKIAAAKGLHEGFSELITNGNDVITGCNQINPDPPGAPGMSGVEPIDWVKDNPDMFEKGIRMASGHTEWDDVVPTGETASTVDI